MNITTFAKQLKLPFLRRAGSCERPHLGNVFCWLYVSGCVVACAQIAFSYLAVIKKLTLATFVLYYSTETVYDFGLFVYTDEHNIVYIVALWLGSGLIYFLDMQIW